jgi:hypothetical protein
MPFRRLLLPAALGVLALAPTAPARAADVLADPGARLFTVAGAPGARSYESDGAPATARRLVASSLGALPSGELVFADARASATSKLWRVDLEGRLHELVGGRGADVLAVEPTGSIVVGLRDTHRLVRVSADGTTSTPIVDLSAQPGVRSAGLVAVAALPGGALAVADDTHVWRIDPDRTVTDLAPKATNVAAMSAAADGTILYFQGSDVFVWRIPPGGGTPARLVETRPGTTTLAPLPDGRMLLGVAGFLDDASGTIELLDPATGARKVIGGAAPSLGNGDGGPLAGVAASATALTATPDGGLAFFDPDDFEGGQLRRLLPAVALHSAATFAQQAYAAAATGKTTVLTTLPGTATVQVRSVASGRLMRTVTGRVAPGASTLEFAPALPRTDVLQTLTFLPAGGAVPVTARITVSTRSTLKLAAVRKVLDASFRTRGGGDDEAGYGIERGTCRRRTAKRVDCIVRDYLETYRPYRKTSRCTGRVLVRQRADGINLTFAPGCAL